MLAGKKRRHEEEHKKVSKRSKFSSSEQSFSSNEPSSTLFTRICNFLRITWLGRILTRHSTPVSSTMFEAGQSTTSHRPPHSTHSIPSFETCIVIDDSDSTGSDSDSFSSCTNMPSSTGRESVSMKMKQYSHRDGNHGNTVLGDGDGRQGNNGYRKTIKVSRYSSRRLNGGKNGYSKVMERITKERGDADFNELLDSYSQMDLSSTNPTSVQRQTSLPHSIGSLSSSPRVPDDCSTTSTTTGPQSTCPIPYLYSVDLPSPPTTCTKRSPYTPSPQSDPSVTCQSMRGRSSVSNVNATSGLFSSPLAQFPLKQHQIMSPPQFPSVSPSPIPRTQPHTRTPRISDPRSRTSTSKISHTQPHLSISCLSYSNTTSYEDVPCDFSNTSPPPASVPNNIQEAFEYPWLNNFNKHEFSKFADSRSRIEAHLKYHEMHKQQRTEAENTRNKKQSERIHNLVIRPWNPHIEEENELVLDLPADLSDMVDEIWSGGALSKVFMERNNIRITRADLLTLRGLEWLNDEIINFYLTMVVDTVNTSSNRKVHLFNSFFYPKLMSNGYTGVRRWTKKVDIFSCDLILLPVHLGMHWCLASIDLNKKLIHYYDSLKGTNMKCLQALRDYLVSEARDKKQMEYDVSEFTLECRKDIPDQHNGSDCGVFTCMYARHLAYDKEMNFSQEDLGSVRRMMVAEIVSNILLRNK